MDTMNLRSQSPPRLVALAHVEAALKSVGFIDERISEAVNIAKRCISGEIKESSLLPFQLNAWQAWHDLRLPNYGKNDPYGVGRDATIYAAVAWLLDPNAERALRCVSILIKRAAVTPSQQ